MEDAAELDAIVTGLRSPELGDRMRAAVLASDRIGEAAIPALVGLLDSAAEPIGTRVWAAIALARLGPRGRPATRVLVEALTNPDPGLRCVVLGALGNLGASDAVRAIAPLLQDHSEVVGAWFEPDLFVSTKAAAVLEQLNTPEALQALAEHRRGEGSHP